ncbi:MAG: hypothetical protein ISR87_14885 [Candidatus Marinimicrobia bacterium]|nr:hypothetical protein [FCB group bacterium]MBL7026726.1 hypothetical protein [Candidatus Neomarinimicrobiota bacterium]
MYKSILAVILFSSLVINANGSDVSTHQNPQFSFSYWNDNFGLQKQLEGVVPPGDDDFMTASWRFEVGLGDNILWRSLEVYYAIFTNRVANNRFDLVAGRYSQEFRRGPWLFKISGGLLVRGSLGGAWLQNQFHASQGYGEVDLPYLSQNRVGGLLYARAAYEVLSHKNNSIQAYSTTALRLGAGPTNFRMGVEGARIFSNDRLPLRGSVTLRLGYAHYLRPSAVMEPHFNYGPVAGLQVGSVYKERVGLAFWFTENQYGLSDPHYGITLSYRNGGLRLPQFHSVMFP